jgi:hypothetical protein
MGEDHFRKLKFLSEAVMGLRAPERFVITGVKPSDDGQITLYLTSELTTMVVKADMKDFDVILRGTDAA